MNNGGKYSFIRPRATTHTVSLLTRDFAAVLQDRMKVVLTDDAVREGDSIVANEIACPGAPPTGRHIRLTVTHVYHAIHGPNIVSVAHERRQAP